MGGEFLRTQLQFFAERSSAFRYHGLYAKNFRPVRKTNIDLFKKMLEPTPRDLVDA